MLDQIFILAQKQNDYSAFGAAMMFFIAMAILAIVSSIPGVNIGFRAVGPPHLKARYKVILKKHFDYYNRLDHKNQRVFEGRVQHFINIKHFIPRSMQHVTAEMKVLIAASAIQLTFGLPKVYLSHFKRILIYPDNYYSVINKVYHKGEVNPLVRTIVLSWKNFVEGYYDKSDGINLGLHEMAHALRLENYIFNDEYNFFDEKVLHLWGELANVEIMNIRQGESSMFRSYGAIDQEEFFAVVIENFFERSKLFFDSCPELYNLTVRLLNQNPLELLHHDQ